MRMYARAVLLLFTFAQATEPTSTSYRNTALHFSFAYPSEFKASLPSPDADRSPSKTSRVGSAVACIDTPVLAEHDIDAFQSELLTVMDIDFGCLKQPTGANNLGIFVTKSLTEGLLQVGTPNMGAAGAYQIDGHDARFRLASTTTGPNSKDIYAGSVCVVMEQHFVCWTALSMDRARVTLLLSSPITFADHAPQALVPAALLIK